MCRNLDGRKKMEYMEHFLLKLKPVLILVFMTGTGAPTLRLKPWIKCGVRTPKSLFGLHVHSCTHWPSRDPPPHLG